MLKQECLWLRNIGAIDENNEHLFNYDLSVFEGDIICISSSTFAKRKLVSKLILGYLQPTNGSIFVAEKECKLYDAKYAFTHGISSSESTDSLVKTMTIEHNLFALRERENPLSLFNEKAAQIQTQNILNTLGLSDLKNKLVQDLSTYQQQLVCMAKSVINHAKVIVVNDTSKNSIEEKLQLIKNIKTYAKNGVSFVIICDEMDDFIGYANRIQYIFDSNQIFEFKDESQFHRFIEEKNNHQVSKKSLIQKSESLDPSKSKMFEAFKYDDVVFEKWFSNKSSFVISGNIDQYFILNFSIKDNICLGIYPKLSTYSVMNKKMLDFTSLEAKKFANIINLDGRIDYLSHLQKLLLLIYRASLQNYKVIILDDIFSEMDDYEWNHLVKALEKLVEKDTLIYFKNCNSYLFKINSPFFNQLDRRHAMMIKKDTKS